MWWIIISVVLIALAYFGERASSRTAADRIAKKIKDKEKEEEDE